MFYQIIGFYNTSKRIYHRVSNYVHYNVDDHENGKDTSDYNYYYDYDNHHVNSFFIKVLNKYLELEELDN